MESVQKMEIKKNNNSFEGWNRVFQLAMGYVHPTVPKLIQQIRKEKSLTNNRLIRLKFGEKPYKCPKYEQLQQRISDTFKNYQNNDLISQLEALSFNFDL